jgi:hypothetical protein
MAPRRRPLANDATLATRDACILLDGRPGWDHSAYGGIGRCRKCGCTALKLRLATAKCPLGKW